MTEKMAVESFVKRCEAEYIKFCGINSFPRYQIVIKELTTKKAQEHGFDSVASTSYDCASGKHKLEICSKLYQPQMNGKYLVFHELTHIMDAETYSQKEKTKHISNRGYTEFHAAQMDFMQLLGAQNLSAPFAFCMEQDVQTFSGKKTAAQFLLQPHEHAEEMIRRTDFPANIEALAITLGLIFNYYGRRSICKMYATDYYDSVDNSIIAQLVRDDTVVALNAYMQGWFDVGKVGLLDTLFQRMAISLARHYELVE